MKGGVTVARERFDRSHAALAEEHRHILSLTTALETAPDNSKLVHRLERLHSVLISHFSKEQFPGGLYESMGAFGSRWHSTLQELIQEHCTILSEARSLLDQARNCAPDERDALQPRIIGLVRLLAEHEEKEHQLATTLKTLSTGRERVEVSTE